MQRAGRGDRDAFGLLVERHHARAIRFAWWHAHDIELAKDAVQESFLRILRAAPGYQQRGSFTAFLLVVVRNMVREMSRRQRRRREEPLDAAPAADPAPGRLADTLPVLTTPETVFEGRELARRLESALCALPGELRAVFVLSELEGLSYQEIARVCGCPMGTVASRKHAAVARLRAMLEPQRSQR
jgi:RNA polymerase sigma-70 factor, ECF subfamily